MCRVWRDKDKYFSGYDELKFLRTELINKSRPFLVKEFPLVVMMYMYLVHLAQDGQERQSESEFQ